MKVTIAEICTIRSGKRLPKGSDFANEVTQYPYIRARDIKAGRIGGEDLAYLTEEVHKKISRYIVNTNDVVITIVGASVGDVALVTEQFDGFNLTENAVRLTEFKDYVNPVYVSYVLNSKSYWELMQQIAGGSAQPKLGIYKIESIPLELPAIETQDRIVDILSAYDNLIENNQKQIKLLEEAAQRLYKEWFVDLRFPGWESAEIVDGVPEGWKETLLSDIAEVNSRQITKKFPYEKIMYVDLSSVRKGHILDYTYYDLKDAPGRAKRLAKDGDIIWGMVRPNLCPYALVMHPTDNTIFSTGFAVLSATTVPFSYLYSLVTQDAFIGYLVNFTNGAAYPAVKPVHFENAKIMKPADDVLSKFNLVAEPLFRKIEMLDSQNTQLAEARDRLLPKLMSGEIEV